MIPALLSWSGGKDAAWTLHALRQCGEAEVVGLVTTITEGHERISMQGIRVEVLRAQAAAAGLPVIEARIPQRADNAAYEASFAASLEQARERWPGIERIAFGDPGDRPDRLALGRSVDRPRLGGPVRAGAAGRGPAGS